MGEPLDIYIRELKGDRYKPLSAKQERELLETWPSKECKRRLIEHNLRFAIEIAKRFRGYPISLEDLVCSGNQGLCIAVDRFDPSRGFKFISYAVWWIRQAIFSAISGSRTVRLPGNVEEGIRNTNNFMTEFYQDHGRYPTAGEVTDFSNTIQREYLVTQKYGSKTWSLDRDFGGEADSPLMLTIADLDAPAPDFEVEKSNFVWKIQKMMDSRLTDQEKDVVCRYFGFGDKKQETLQEIAGTYGLTRERIRQIKRKALKKLKYPSKKLIRELV